MTTAAQLTPAERAFAASCGLSPEAFAATRAANRSTRAQTEGQRTEQAAQMAADAIPGMTGQTALHMIRTGTNPHQVQVRKLVTNGVHRTQAEADAASAGGGRERLRVVAQSGCELQAGVVEAVASTAP